MGGLATYQAPWPIFALSWSSYGASSSSSSSSAYPSTSPSPAAATAVSSSSRRGHSHEDEEVPFGSRIAIGSLLEDQANSIQVLGHIGDYDSAGQARLSLLASASHPYPATKVAFQPSSLSSDRADRSHMSPSSKLANRASWGAGSENANNGQHPSSAPLSPSRRGHSPAFIPNDEAHDGYPNRELLASTADCLRIWECSRNPDVGNGGPEDWDQRGGGAGSSGHDDEEAAAGMGSGAGGYAGWKGRNAVSSSRLRFGLREKSVLAHSKSSMSPPAPLTSFSWNQPSPNLIVTSSIDTTCTVWDLPTRTALTQLIAHDREVYDVDWCPGSSDVFASVGADGSVRVFDLRSLEHSTIIYETGGPPAPTNSGSRPGTGMSSSSSRNGSTAGGQGGGEVPAAPLLRIAFNPWDANYLATFHLESDSIQILDVRAPGLPILELKGHRAGINAVAWGPPSLSSSNTNSLTTTPGGSSSSSISKGMISTASDDAQVLVYDLASSTLRTASAQGRRSRNSTAAAAATSSPAPSGAHHSHHHSLSHSLSSASLSSAGWGSGTPVEYPFLAYESKEMVNNVAWFRPAHGGGSTGGSGTHGRSASMGGSALVQEWNEYAANARSGGGSGGRASGAPIRQDWMACVAGRELRALKVS